MGSADDQPGTGMGEMSRQDAVGARLGNEAEGYLLWQATIAVAEERAREFVRPMDWLTTSQRVEIERHYVTDSLQRARQDLERIAARCVATRGVRAALPKAAVALHGRGAGPLRRPHLRDGRVPDPLRTPSREAVATPATAAPGFTRR